MDVTVIPDEDIMQHRSMAALTLLQKHIRQRDLKEVLDLLALLMAAEFMTGKQLHRYTHFRRGKQLTQASLFESAEGTIT